MTAAVCACQPVPIVALPDRLLLTNNTYKIPSTAVFCTHLTCRLICAVGITDMVAITNLIWVILQ